MLKETNIGEEVRILRTEKKITRNRLAEMIGISVSHLEKIESGERRPGIGTFFKILEVLKADIITYDDSEAGRCLFRMQEILRHCTDEQAVFMLKIMECIAENLDIIANHTC